MAWNYDQLHPLGTLARIGSLHPKPLERTPPNALSQCGPKSTVSTCIANRWYIAHFSFRRAGLGVLRIERPFIIVAGVCKALQFVVAPVLAGSTKTKCKRPTLVFVF